MKNSALVSLLLISNLLFSQQFIAKYEFNGNAKDSKNRLNGIVNGASLTIDRTNKSNRAFYFDGIDDYIEIKNGLLNISNSGSFSIETFVKLEPNSNGGTIFSFYGCPSHDPELKFDLFLLIYNQSSLFLSHRTIDSEGNQESLTIPIPNDFFSNYHHIVALRDGNSAQLKLYIDGKLAGVLDQISTNKLGSYITHIGKHVSCNPDDQEHYYLKGVIDYFNIRNGIITDKQVERLYKSANKKPKNNCSNNQDEDNSNENITQELNESEFNKQVNLIKVFPNPTYGILNINASNLLNISRITLVNMCGQVAYENVFQNSINTDCMRPGIYILTLWSERKNISYRVSVM